MLRTRSKLWLSTSNVNISFKMIHTLVIPLLLKQLRGLKCQLQNGTLCFKLKCVGFRGQTHFKPEIFKMLYLRNYKTKCVETNNGIEKLAGKFIFKTG